MSRVTPQRKHRTKSQQRDDRRKMVQRLEKVNMQLLPIANLQQRQLDRRVEKYSCLGLSERDIGSPGHTPQGFRDAYQDFSDLYGRFFDDDNDNNNNSHNSHNNINNNDNNNERYPDDPSNTRKAKDRDRDSPSPDSPTASEMYNMFNISETTLRMASGFPGWVPDYGTRRVKAYGPNSPVSSVSSVSPPPDMRRRDQNSTSEPISPPPAIDGMMHCDCDFDSVGRTSSGSISLSPPASQDAGFTYGYGSERASDDERGSISVPSVEMGYESGSESSMRRDSDATLSDPEREDPDEDGDSEDGDGDADGDRANNEVISDAMSIASFNSPLRTNKPVNHQFFYLHHRVPKREPPNYLSSIPKRPKN